MPAEPARTPQPTQPVPESDDEPELVWEDHKLGWVTDAPPPEEFDGDEEGTYGEEDYCRTLTDEELAIWEAPILAEREQRRAEHAAEWQAFLAACALANAQAAAEATSRH